MRQEKQSFSKDILDSFEFPKRFMEISLRELVCLLCVAIIILFGASGAYLLGVLFVVPMPIARLFNESTLLHIAGDLSLLVVVGWSFYKISWLAITGLYVWWLFILCKFIIGPKYDGGLRNPVVARYQFGRVRRFLVKRKKEILIGRLFLTMIFLYSLFFRFSDGEFIVQPGIWTLIYVSLFGGIPLAIFGTLAAFKVGSRISLREFIRTSEGRLLFVITVLFMIAIIGAWRTFALTAADMFHYPTETGTCQLAPMFPVFGGDLFFEKQSQSYIVLDKQNRGFYWREQSNLPTPSCLPDHDSVIADETEK